MTALLTKDLYADTFCDFVQGLLVLSGGATMVGLTVTSAQLTVRVTPQDPAPLVVATTAAGQLTFGVAPPSPVGTQCANVAELESAAPLTLQTTVPSPVAETFATIAAMALFDAVNLTVGQLAIVASGVGSFYQWSPGDTTAPNGTTVVASTGSTPGNWLLAVTVQVQITQALLAPLVGVSRAAWDLLVTWAGGTTTKLIEGSFFVDQSVGGH